MSLVPLCLERLRGSATSTHAWAASKRLEEAKVAPNLGGQES